MITIDNREHKLIELFKRNEVKITVEALTIGDITIRTANGSELVIERKTHGDLHSSLTAKGDGADRYENQLARLIEHRNANPTGVSLLYLFEKSGKSRLRPAIYRGVKTSLISKYGIPFIESTGLADTFKLITEMTAKRIELDKDPSLSAPEVINIVTAKKKSDYTTPRTFCIASLRNIPSFGMKTAVRLADQVPSFAALCGEISEAEDPKVLLHGYGLNRRNIDELIKYGRR